MQIVFISLNNEFNELAKKDKFKVYDIKVENLITRCSTYYESCQFSWIYKIESMGDVSTQLTQDQVKDLIKQIYLAYVETIRNLSNVAT